MVAQFDRCFRSLPCGPHCHTTDYPVLPLLVSSAAQGSEYWVVPPQPPPWCCSGSALSLLILPPNPNPQLIIYALPSTSTTMQTTPERFLQPRHFSLLADLTTPLAVPQCLQCQMDPTRLNPCFPTSHLYQSVPKSPRVSWS